MRLFRCAALLLALSLILSSCGGGEVPSESGAQETAPVERYAYDLSEYLEMGDPDSFRVTVSDPSVVTDEELEAAVFQVLLANASFTEKSGPAEGYNKLVIDFSLFYGGELQEEYSRKDFTLVLGDASNPELEQALAEVLIGAAAGEVRSVDYTYPDTAAAGLWRGKTVKASATVKTVLQHSLPECNDEFARSLKGMNFESAEEFRASLREDILAEKEKALLSTVWIEFVKTVTVLRYPEKELTAYQADYRSYYEMQALQEALSLEEYVTEVLESDMPSFEAEVLNYARELCRNDMIFCRLARHFQTTLSEEEYNVGLSSYYEAVSGSFSSPEEYEAYYGKDQIREELIWHKALRTLVEKATGESAA